MNLASDLHKALNGKKPTLWTRRPEVLLCPNIPKPMHGVAPREILGQKWWNEIRRTAYSSTDYHCIACGVHKTVAKGPAWLEGHELYDIDYKHGRMCYQETLPLCHYCHSYIHDGRLVALRRKKQLTVLKYTAIIKHGDRVLHAAGLRRDTYKDREEAMIGMILNNEVAKWKDWRLVLFGNEYPPKFKNSKHWEKAFEK